ncbi:MAG: PA2779 family protein [Thermodesulfobacteriota bacterium]
MLKMEGIRFLIIGIILFTFIPVSLITTSANASFKDSQFITESGETISSRDIDEIKVRRSLENKLVAEKLMSHGLTKEQVIVKMDKMSDEEVHQFASLSDRIPAGGDSGIGIVVAVLVIIALVLVILYLYKRV